MKKHIAVAKIFTVVMILSAVVSAQIGYGTAKRIQYGTVLPGTCSPTTGDVYFLTVGNVGVYQCTAENSWTAVGSVTSGGFANITNAASYATAQDAFTAAGPSGTVLIPSNFLGSMSFSNGSHIPVLDLTGPDKLRGFHSIRDFGARGDGQVFYDGAMNATFSTLTSSLASFTSADIGKLISVFGAGAAGASLDSTILSVTDSHNVVLANAASTTVTSKLYVFGTDDSTAINSAITYLWGGATFTKNVRGGALWFPKGTYVVGSSIVANDVNGGVGIKLLGPGTENVGQGAVGAAQIVYVGTGAGSAFDFRSSYGTMVDGVSMRYASSNFTGTVVDFNHSSGGHPDAAYGIIRNNIIGGLEGLSSATYCVSLRSAIIVHIDHNHIQFCGIGVTGTQGATSYSNANAITYNTFDNLNVSALTDAGGQSWIVDHNIFEGPRFGAGLGLAMVYKDTVNTGAPSLQFTNNWIGDCSPDVGANWMVFQKQVGLVVRDNAFEACPAGPLLKFTASWSGVTISGNTFANANTQAAIDLGNFAGQSNGAIITGNSFASTSVAPIAYTFNGASNVVIMGNYSLSVPPQQPNLIDADVQMIKNFRIGQLLASTDCSNGVAIVCMHTITIPSSNPTAGSVVMYNSGTALSSRDSNGGIDTFSAPSSAVSFNNIIGRNLTNKAFVFAGTGSFGNSTLKSSAAVADGEILIGSTGNDPVKATLSATANQTTVTNASGSITIGLAGISDTRELLQSVHFCGTTTTCANTANGSNRTVYGRVALVSGTPSTATIASISPAFTSTSTYGCVATNETTQANPIKVSYVSGSSFTLTGPNTVTDSVFYACVGN